MKMKYRVEFEEGAENILFGINCEILEEGADYALFETEKELTGREEQILDTNPAVNIYGFACKTCKQIATEGDYCSEACFLQAGSDRESDSI